MTGWRSAFEALKHEYIRQALLLLEVADAEALTSERDRIYKFVERSAFIHEIMALKDARQRSDIEQAQQDIIAHLQALDVWQENHKQEPHQESLNHGSPAEHLLWQIAAYVRTLLSKPVTIHEDGFRNDLRSWMRRYNQWYPGKK